MDTAEAAGAHEADADRGGCRERPAHGRRADDALHRAGREVARPELAGARREALELRRPSRPITTRPSSTPTVAGTAPAARTAVSLARPTSIPAGRREPVRDERRLERDDRAPFLERCVDLVGDADEVLHAAQRSRVASLAASVRVGEDHALARLVVRDDEAAQERVADQPVVDDLLEHHVGAGLRE